MLGVRVLERKSPSSPSRRLTRAAAPDAVRQFEPGRPRAETTRPLGEACSGNDADHRRHPVARERRRGGPREFGLGAARCRHARFGCKRTETRACGRQFREGDPVFSDTQIVNVGGNIGELDLAGWLKLMGAPAAAGGGAGKAPKPLTAYLRAAKFGVGKIDYLGLSFSDVPVAISEANAPGASRPTVPTSSVPSRCRGHRTLRRRGTFSSSA